MPSNLSDLQSNGEPAAPTRAQPLTTFRVLGPVEASRDGVPLDLGSTKQRALLAILLCRANTTVAVHEVVDILWPENPPRSALKNLQSYASGLRRGVVRDDTGSSLAYRPPGYQMSLTPGSLDLLTFETLVRQGKASLRGGDHEAAAAELRAALRLWRGPALREFSAFPALREQADRLEARRLDCFENLIEAELALGRADDLIEEIEDLSRAHPLRERLRSLQMSVLHRCDRPAEALAVYDELRQLLARELGLSPSPALQRKYRTILGDDHDHDAGSGPQHRGRPHSPGRTPGRPAGSRPKYSVADLMRPFAHDFA